VRWMWINGDILNIKENGLIGTTDWHRVEGSWV
jgi:hypothetical protein